MYGRGLGHSEHLLLACAFDLPDPVTLAIRHLAKRLHHSTAEAAVLARKDCCKVPATSQMLGSACLPTRLRLHQKYARSSVLTLLGGAKQDSYDDFVQLDV